MNNINDYFNLEHYSVENLKKDSMNDIQNFCERCNDYFILDQGKEADRDVGGNILEALPPEKGYDDKFVLGVYNVDNRMIGLIDIIKSYPTENEWMLGFLLIDPDERNKGLGKLLHQGLIYWIKSQNGEKIRIGVLEENKKGFKFWQDLGYKLIKESEFKREGKKDKQISVMKFYI